MPNIPIIGILKGRNLSLFRKSIFELREENFTSLEKDLAIQTHKIQRTLTIINLRRLSPWHIIDRFVKVKDKEEILNMAREKHQVMYKGYPLRLSDLN